MTSPTRNDFDHAQTAATSSTDERRLTVRDDSSGPARWRTDLDRDLAESDAKRQEMLERALAGCPGWGELTRAIDELSRHRAEMKRRTDELSRRVKELESLRPWARAVFVRQRYDLSHDFVLAFRSWLKLQLPRNVTDGVPERDLLDKLKTLSVWRRGTLQLDARVLALASLARFLLHYLADQLRIGAHWPCLVPSPHDFVDFAAPLVGQDVARELADKLSRITVSPEDVPESAQWVVSTPGYEHKRVTEMGRAMKALHERFVEAWGTNRSPFEEESEEAVRYFKNVA